MQINKNFTARQFAGQKTEALYWATYRHNSDALLNTKDFPPILIDPLLPLPKVFRGQQHFMTGV